MSIRCFSGERVYFKPFNSILRNSSDRSYVSTHDYISKYIRHYNNSNIYTIHNVGSSGTVFDSNDFDCGEYGYGLNAIDRNRKVIEN